MTVRVADFGMAVTCNGSYKSDEDEGKMPLKWMAPEAVREQRYTKKTDVWMFAVCGWEIFATGIKPFLEIPALDYLRHVESGNRLVRKPGCPKAIYEVFESCWALDPEERPGFQEINRRIRVVLDKFSAQGLPKLTDVQWRHLGGGQRDVLGKSAQSSGQAKAPHARRKAQDYVSRKKGGDYVSRKKGGDYVSRKKTTDQAVKKKSGDYVSKKRATGSDYVRGSSSRGTGDYVKGRGGNKRAGAGTGTRKKAAGAPEPMPRPGRNASKSSKLNTDSVSRKDASKKAREPVPKKGAPGAESGVTAKVKPGTPKRSNNPFAPSSNSPKSVPVQDGQLKTQEPSSNLGGLAEMLGVIGLDGIVGEGSADTGASKPEVAQPAGSMHVKKQPGSEPARKSDTDSWISMLAGTGPNSSSSSDSESESDSSSEYDSDDDASNRILWQEVNLTPGYRSKTLQWRPPSGDFAWEIRASVPIAVRGPC